MLFEWKTCAITIPEKKKQLFLRVNFWSVRRGVLNEKISSKQSHPMFSEHYFQLVINWWREDLTISPLLVNTDRERRSIYINIALSLCYKELPTRAIAVTGRQKRTQSTCILHRLHHVRAALKQEAERFPMPHADRIIVTTTDGDHTSAEVIVGLIRTHIGGIYNVWTQFCIVNWYYHMPWGSDVYHVHGRRVEKIWM